jgi:hypothetical protein
MHIARPTVTEERWLALAGRHAGLHAAVERAGHGGGWKTTTWLGRCLGFLLGLLGTGMLAGVLFAFPAPLLVGGMLLMVAAEWLVAQRRVFRSGIEEAVYLCGAIAVIAQLLVWSNGSNDALGCACIATAVLLVGWRLLNPLFTTLAFAGYSLAIALVGGSLFGGGLNTFGAGIACVVFAVVALLAGAREWQRPAHDRMLDGLVIVMPWLAHGWLTAYGWRGNAAIAWSALALALAAGFLLVNLIAGVKRRQHAPLIGALGNLVCVAYALHRLVAWPMYWQLIVAGASALAVAVLLDRRLRGRARGITSRPLDEPAGMELAQLAGAAHIVPGPGAAAGTGTQGQGGGFGGGGASGKF